MLIQFVQSLLTPRKSDFILFTFDANLCTLIFLGKAYIPVWLI